MTETRYAIPLACIAVLSLAAAIRPADAATITNTYSSTQTVSTDLVDPGGGDILAVRVTAGVVTFTGANTYSGGTEVLGGGTNVASSTAPLGSGDIIVRNGGALKLDQSDLQGVTLANTFYLNDGATLETTSGGSYGDTTLTLSSNIYLGGSVTVIVSLGGYISKSHLSITGIVQNDGADTGRLVATPRGDDTDLGHLKLFGDNTYTGGTTIGAYGSVWAAHNNALGTGSVNVLGDGKLRLVSSTITNNLTFQDGSRLENDQGGEGIDGIITLNGAVDVYSGMNAINVYLHLNQNSGKITGTGSLHFIGAYWMGWNGVDIYGNNDFSGATTVGGGVGKGILVKLHSATALGTNINTVTIYGVPANNATLQIDSSGLHTNKSVAVSTNGVFYQEPVGTTVSNAMTMAGGIYVYPVGGSSYYNGAITLAAGTTNTFRSAAWAGGDWHQTGTMSGSGALTFDHEYAGSANRHLSGNNSGYSGTVYGSPDATIKCYVGSDNGLGTGTFVLLGTDGSSTVLRLDTSVTLANAFQGTGKVDTITYTLTHTGALIPGTAGAIGPLTFASSGAGKLDFRGTCYWDYNATTNDVISADNLVFGNSGGQAAVNVSWVGAGNAPRPSGGGDQYVLFTYTSATHPVITTPWTVTAPAGIRGYVTVETATKHVILTLEQIPAAGTTIRIR